MKTIVVFGASGDLAKRKTFPALFNLFCSGYLTDPFRVIGYARTKMDKEEFIKRILPFIDTAGPDFSKDRLDAFIENCNYIYGPYDGDDGFLTLEKVIGEYERSDASPEPEEGHTRIFYLALPPSAFIETATEIKKHLFLSTRSNRLVIEKPFGKDLESSNELSAELAKLFSERDLYRIDHYLGKEMVKNMMVLRFGNLFFNALWNRHCVANVQIVFKEKIGVEGRGGYFDEYGIIRDVMQNHLLQMLSVVAMDRPATLAAEDIRDEKVKVLRCIQPISLDQIILGQYTRSVDGSKPGYTEDPTVPAGSLAPTFAMTVLYVNNERWAGVPFIVKSGKGLSEQKAEIRIQFKDVPGLLLNPDIARNELVIRVQPNEAVYLKMIVKRPGLGTEPILSDLDLSYATRYHGVRIPEAYESLILDVLKEDHSNFVRSDELEAAWKIFTPVLHRIDSERVVPIPYPFGSRGPEAADALTHRLGYKRHTMTYQWSDKN